MRSAGLWHPGLLQLVASLGHGDLLVVADAGLPVPPGVESVDLLWHAGEPRFLPVLGTLLDELVVERATLAREAADPALLAGLDAAFGPRGIPVDRLSHDRLKQLSTTARAVVRTGETTPYANAVLRAGVPF
ncbi:hypothetical protein CFP65_0079 [Kitasatospora sp. MMS16-BH015]|uniref:D-ribose pyranase n=1 Tax=Kitasatospora sp. MMS16-BH015 TaxID=2018025 RepID=UPI000CA29D29|nr:D-ribose pyranase [Kitasatospora sp. MMS16-BH015]AUG75063.1 hypothetical protein CFP65_0079 [Kitasatospora sp. MMS16-BH015]